MSPARQPLEGIGPELRETEVDEMVRIVFPPDHPPRVGVDDADDDLGPVLVEERLQLGWKQIDRPRHDVAVRRSPPGQRWGGREQRNRHRRQRESGNPEFFSHAVILATGGDARTTYSRKLDNLTHSLFAVTLARTPLGRAGRGTTTALVLASNAPDIDIVGLLGGPATYLQWHRGPMHGPIGVVGLGVLSAAVVAAARRLKPASTSQNREAPFSMLVAVSILGTLLHVLMDLATSYGTRVLSPFSWRWFAVDWMPIIDVYLLVVLAAGLLFGRASADARRRNAAIVLMLMAANYGVRAAAHHRGLALAPRLFGPTLPPPCDSAPPQLSVLDSWPHPPPSAPSGRTRCLVEMAAIPTLSPFSWLVIAQMSNAYELHDLDVLDARFREPATGSEVFWRRSVRYPNVWTHEAHAAAASRLGQVFLGFSRFPDVRSAVDREGTTTVRFTDMRFVGAPIAIDQPSRGASLFTAFVRIDSSGRVISERLGR